MRRGRPDQIHRKFKKLARRCAEANTWSNVETLETLKDFSDVFNEAFELVRLAGYFPEYERREKQIQRARNK